MLKQYKNIKNIYFFKKTILIIFLNIFLFWNALK